mmetsp:Transcript_26768/g.77184  ORF Transcript_26768/g.77184 Transcript_26768/m.77184 type:complete len:205 (-) Transcript_26768:687-1301(-)
MDAGGDARAAAPAAAPAAEAEAEAVAAADAAARAEATRAEQRRICAAGSSLIRMSTCRCLCVCDALDEHLPPLVRVRFLPDPPWRLLPTSTSLLFRFHVLPDVVPWDALACTSRQPPWRSSFPARSSSRSIHVRAAYVPPISSRPPPPLASGLWWWLAAADVIPVDAPLFWPTRSGQARSRCVISSANSLRVGNHRHSDSWACG